MMKNDLLNKNTVYFKSNSLCSFYMIYGPYVYIIVNSTVTKTIPILDWLTRRVKSYNAIFSAFCLHNIIKFLHF